MKPISFNEANHVINPENRIKAPVDFKSMEVFDAGHYVVSRWEFTFKERLMLLFFGKVWMFVCGSRQPPIAFSVRNKNLFVNTKDKPGNIFI